MEYHNYPHQKYTREIINKLKVKEQQLVKLGYTRHKAHKEISAQSKKLIGERISVRTIYCWLTPHQWQKKRIAERKRYQRNPQIFKERTRKWRQNNPELYRVQSRRQYYKNHEESKRKAKILSKRYKVYAKNYRQSPQYAICQDFRRNPYEKLCDIMAPNETYSIDELTRRLSLLLSHNFLRKTVHNAIDRIIEQSTDKIRSPPIIQVGDGRYQINNNYPSFQYRLIFF